MDEPENSPIPSRDFSHEEIHYGFSLCNLERVTFLLRHLPI